jgi:hypothetical protein
MQPCGAKKVVIEPIPSPVYVAEHVFKRSIALCCLKDPNGPSLLVQHPLRQAHNDNALCSAEREKIMGGVPSVPTDPDKSLQVIGAGFARTGTVSMALALEKILDGPVCHGGTQLLGREDGKDSLSLSSYFI